MSDYQDRLGAPKRAEADHRIRAATAERRASLLSRDDARPDGRSLMERLQRWLRR